MKKNAFILNLCTEIPRSYLEYFSSRGIKVVDPKVDEGSYKWTHILTQDMNDFGFIRETYQTIEEDIQIISLTAVSDKQNFVLSNGKLCLDDFWIKTEIKDFLLDKFFQDYLESIESENAVFSEIGQFSVNQFFSFGDQIDRLTKAAFSMQVQGLAVKSYLDHFMMYLAALKGSEKMELPVDIAYANSENAFGVQIYFSAQNLMMDDVSACLSLHNSRFTEETLLSSAINFCDFFDFSLVSNAQKISVTALWVKNERLEHPSFMLSYLPHKARIVSYIKEEEELKDRDFSDTEINVVLPQAKKESDGTRHISKESFSEVIATRISQTVELEKVEKIVGSDLTDEDIYQLFTQSAEDEAKIVVASEDEFEEVITKVASAFDSLEVYNKDFFKESEVLDEVINSLRDNHSDIMNVKSLGGQLTENLKKSLASYCQAKMIVSDNLKREHIDDFKVHFLKNNLRKDTVVLDAKGKSLIKDLKARLENRLKNEFQEESAVKVVSHAKTNESDTLRVKSILKETLKEALEVNFEFSRYGTISENQENEIVRSLSSSLGEDKQIIKAIINDDNGTKPHNPLFASQVSEREKALLVKVESLTQEKKGLADKLQTTLMEIRVLKESKSTVAAIQSKASDVSSKETQQDVFDQNALIKKELQEKMALGELSPQDQKKMTALMEKELVLMTAVRDEVMKSKKLQIEATQKEALFTSQLEKLNRQLKARDIILNKSKESMVKLSEKKDADIEYLQNKLNQIQIDSAKGNQQNYALKNKHLEIQNLNLSKQLDVYKAKMNSLSTNLKEKDNSDSFKEDIRKLKIESVQLQNIIRKTNKELQRATSRGDLSDKVAEKLKLEVKALEQENTELKKKEVKVTSAEVAKVGTAAVVNPAIEEAYQKKVKDLTTQVADLEQRLLEVSRAQRNAALDDKKLQHLEGNIKKLTQDLIESRNQTNDFKKENNKLRQEKTAIQNQIDRMRKEAMKNKKAG